MEITDIRIRKLMPAPIIETDPASDGHVQGGRLRGIISITLDGTVAIHDIKVVQGDERLFVAMPSRRDDSGVYRDIVHPITPAARSQIEGSILSAYREELERQQAEQNM